MASWSSTCCLYLGVLILTINLSALASPPHYSIHHTKVTFDQAMENCSPGVLTTLATQQEVTHILRLISQAALPHTHFIFWVGLKKAKDRCVVPTRPLRGFQWVEDGSEETQVSHWLKEPEDTCTTVRCAALQGAFNESRAMRWGLIAVTCRDTSLHQFICKARDSQTTHTAVKTRTTIQPATLEPVTTTTATPQPLQPIKLEPQTPLQGQEPVTEHELLGPDLDPVLGSDVCQNPRIPGARALRPDPDHSGRIQVECWSTIKLELYCKGRPAMWHHPDDSLANFTTVCQPCSDGFRKNASGICVDTDECSSAPCRHTCLNTEGSYRCVCSDESGEQHDEGSAACTGLATAGDRWLLSILVPVVVVVVVLVVVVAVTVKCCLMRGSKKRKLEKSETMAMQNKDSKDS